MSSFIFTEKPFLKRLYFCLIYQACDLSISDEDIRNEFFPGKAAKKYLPGDTRGWHLTEARRKIASNNHDSYIRTIAYRPFDKRYIYYCHDMVDWDRENVMRHFILGDNLGLCLIRINRDDLCTALITDDITDKTILSSKDNANIFPLYLYSGGGLISEKRPNSNPEIVRLIEKSLGYSFAESSTKGGEELSQLRIYWIIFIAFFILRAIEKNMEIY